MNWKDMFKKVCVTLYGFVRTISIKLYKNISERQNRPTAHEEEHWDEDIVGTRHKTIKRPALPSWKDVHEVTTKNHFEGFLDEGTKFDEDAFTKKIREVL